LTWGDNFFGQLGIGPHPNSPIPIEVPGLTMVTAVSAKSHTLALQSDGTVLIWGSGKQNSNVPQPVPNLHNVKAVSAGAGFSLALINDGTVVAWGSNISGVLGDGTTKHRESPVPVLKLTNIIAIAAGWTHCLALTENGRVWTWGETGNPPVQLDDFTNVSAIAAGEYHSLALKSGGDVWAWGGGQFGQVGNGKDYLGSARPTAVVGLPKIIKIAAGLVHSLALDSNGAVWGWGSNQNDQLGNFNAVIKINQNGVTNIPVRTLTVSNATRIAAGDRHSLALEANGTVWAWGSDASGELGDGQKGGSEVVQADVLTDAIAIAAGNSFSVAVAKPSPQVPPSPPIPPECAQLTKDIAYAQATLGYWKKKVANEQPGSQKKKDQDMVTMWSKQLTALQAAYAMAGCKPGVPSKTPKTH
jgi:alpha-tubulin suppressor-like RCC1 family protein